MLEKAPAIEKDIRDMSKGIVRTLDLLVTASALPGPTLYQQVTRSLSDLGQMWAAHRGRLSSSLSLIAEHEPEFASFCARFERDAEDMSHELEALNSAGWPRRPEIGVASIRVRVKETLTTLLRQLEAERMAVLPLMRKWTAPVAEAEELASAS